jgi:hypothetical protein
LHDDWPGRVCSALEDLQEQHTIELNITLADGGSSAKEVIELYGARVRNYIDQTAWNLCNCDD